MLRRRLNSPQWRHARSTIDVIHSEHHNHPGQNSKSEFHNAQHLTNQTLAQPFVEHIRTSLEHRLESNISPMSRAHIHCTVQIKAISPKISPRIIESCPSWDPEPA
ncbi:hypothetical protein RSAG8_07485, partial [Rhizoctonia solani AG-8 WAC10335]